MTTEELCPKCTLPRDKKGSGSLTQWMTTCSCDRDGASKAENIQALSLNLCKKCGKRADKGRVGSLTQFIFRYDLCSCEGAAFAQKHGIIREPGLSAGMSCRTAGTSDQTAGTSGQTSGTSGPGTSDRTLDESQWQQEPEDALAVDQEVFPRERYKPLKLMGKGAEGTVYLCRDLLLNKLVAIKLLNVLTDAQLQSFQLEAKLLSKLDHPNIVRILDFGVTASGAPYMVLEQTEGVSLDQFLKDHGPLSWRAAAKLFLPLSKALNYCHANGIFHRDLKPGNILLLGNTSWLSESTAPTDEPTVQLVDFGVAKHIGSTRDIGVSETDGSVESKEAMIGTPSFMAPDVARGLSFDARSEIYSLAAPCTPH
jgi:Serine/threonine protein kinase